MRLWFNLLLKSAAEKAQKACTDAVNITISGEGRFELDRIQLIQQTRDCEYKAEDTNKSMNGRPDDVGGRVSKLACTMLQSVRG